MYIHEAQTLGVAWRTGRGGGGVVSQRDVGEEVGDRLTVVRAPYRLSQNHADIDHLVTPTKTNHDTSSLPPLL